MTVVLARSGVDSLVDVGQVMEILREGFRAPVAQQPSLRIRTDLPGPGTATCLMPGLLPGVEAYTVKVNAKFPGATPALRGVVCLHDLQSGELLALADSAAVTAWRTGLAAALGTHLLAAPGADLLLAAHVIVDDLGFATAAGALANAGLDDGAAAGTLSEVLQGTLAARHSEDAVTVYAPVGLPWQDLALTWALYSRATRSDQIIIDLLA